MEIGSWIGRWPVVRQLRDGDRSGRGTARRLALLGAGIELGAMLQLERRSGLSTEPYRTGRAGRLGRWARRLTVGGAVAGAVLGRRSRAAAIAAGAALVAGSVCARFAVYGAGAASAEDPKFTVVPQRQRQGS